MTGDQTTCRRCEAQNFPRNRFCGHCGASLHTQGTTPDTPPGQPTPKLAELTPVRTRILSSRLKGVLGEIGKPLALGALVLVAEVLAEAGVVWMSNRAGGHDGNTLSSRPEPANTPFSGGAHLELKSYEELAVFARDGDQVSRLFATRNVFGPPGDDG